MPCNKSYLTCLLALLAGVALGKNASHEVTSLPGLEKLTSKLYAGMYNVSKTRGLFYTMVES